MNILGESFKDYVDKQVKVRQDKYSAGFNSSRSSEDQTFLNSRTAFARLMSSVEVNSKSNYTYVNNLGFADLNLAKQYVLFAGTSTSVSGSQRSGIGIDGAYGLGDFEMGARPMPGITSVDVKTDGDGYTNSATIKVKAYNRNQLEIIDALYLRLGYYMLLEWGNVIYWDNNNTLVNDPYNNSLQDYFFDLNNKNINNVLKQIKIKREASCGNYDALFGRVLNFNWTYAADGTFDITINLRSMGDIIEGLKINTQKTITPTISGIVSPLELYKNKNAIGSLYYTVVEKIFDRGGEIFKEPLTNSITNPGDVSFCKIHPTGSTSAQYYVKFDRFLAELQKSYVLKFNGNESLNINFEKGKTLIPINELTISVDPSVCIISRKDTINPRALFVGATTAIDDNFSWDFYTYLDSFVYDAGPNVKALYGDLMNVYLNFEFLLKKLDDITDAKTNRASFKRYLNEVLIEVSRALGNANKLQIFIDTETNTVKIIDKNPYPYKDELLAKVSKVSNPKETVFNITGYYPTTTGAKTTSFVKNLNIQTTIPPEFATIISIGAAANKKSVGEDSTAFSKLNEGLSTRFAKTVTDGNEKINSGLDETPDSLLTSAKSYLEYCVAGSSGISWNTDVFETNKSILAGLILYINKVKSKEDEKSANSTSSPTSGFIPVNVSLTMDGLSGMKIFQRFGIDTTYLPSNYPNAVEILIKGISHKIQNNIWETTVDSLIVGKSNTTTNSKPSTSRRTSSSGAGAGAGSAEIPPPADLAWNTFLYPVSGYVSSTIGPRGGRTHQGIDIAGNNLYPVYSSTDGIVTEARSARGYGPNCVVIKIISPFNTSATEWRITYGHMNSMIVSKGDPVYAGQQIGFVGNLGRSDGPHLHYQIGKIDFSINPYININQYFPLGRRITAGTKFY
jgi:murein DD-endopeptidase MepM/ murein hydrolase activator NlpD